MALIKGLPKIAEIERTEKKRKITADERG